jgi:hypothetical protein
MTAKYLKCDAGTSVSGWNHRLKTIDSEKIDYESAFECCADRLAWGGAVHFVNISQNQARCSTAGR